MILVTVERLAAGCCFSSAAWQPWKRRFWLSLQLQFLCCLCSFVMEECLSLEFLRTLSDFSSINHIGNFPLPCWTHSNFGSSQQFTNTSRFYEIQDATFLRLKRRFLEIFGRSSCKSHSFTWCRRWRERKRTLSKLYVCFIQPSLIFNWKPLLRLSLSQPFGTNLIIQVGYLQLYFFLAAFSNATKVKFWRKIVI